MNGDTPPKGQFPESDSRGIGEDPPPTLKGSESPLKWPFLKLKDDAVRKKKRTRYKLKIRNRCVECQPEGMGAIRNCTCFECPLWQYRPFKSKRLASGGSSAERLAGVGLEEAGEISRRISEARKGVIAKVEKYCTQKIGYFIRAYSGKSRKAALLADDLYLANYEAKMVDTDLCSLEPVSE